MKEAQRQAADRPGAAAEVPGIDERAFEQQAEPAKQNCPISKLLSAAEITLLAKLIDSGGGR